jgi:hypothetical protein
MFVQKVPDVLYWWARIAGASPRGYGRWVPTLCLDRTEAIFYMETVYPGSYVKEWTRL